jgi:polar amino acid transport system permease protein
VRGTPLLLQLFAVFYLPPLIGLDLSPFASGVLALGLNGGAYTAEILRGGIRALPRGQTESSRALGLSAFQTVRRIVLPQVVVNVLPALANETAALIKASSLVSALALVELTRVGYQVVSRVLRPTEIYVAVGALYLVMNAVVSLGASVAQRRLGAYR